MSPVVLILKFHREIAESLWQLSAVRAILGLTPEPETLKETCHIWLPPNSKCAHLKQKRQKAKSKVERKNGKRKNQRSTQRKGAKPLAQEALEHEKDTRQSPLGPAGEGSGVVTAVAQVRSLAQELLHVVGVPPPPPNKERHGPKGKFKNVQRTSTGNFSNGR